MAENVSTAGPPVAVRLGSRTREMRGEFCRYLVVGGAAFLVDSGSLVLLTSVAGIHYLASAAIAFVLGLVSNYFLSRSWVFRRRALTSRTTEFTVFALIGVVGLGLNELLIWYFTDKVGIHYLLSKCCAAALVLAWTFLARKWALFSDERITPAVAWSSAVQWAGVRVRPAHRAERSAAFWVAGAFALYLGAVVALQWTGSAYRYPMMQYPDESAHYVTGIMVHDYLVRPSVHPLDFAEDFYRHYPRVSLLHWPPVMYMLEGAWMTVFGTSPNSALLLIAFLTAALAALLHRYASRHLGWPYGVMAALLFILLRITQEQAGMIMIEALLAVLMLAACLAFTAYLETNQLRYSMLFGCFASAAILTKGDGWCLALVPLPALFICGKTSWLRNWSLWAPAFLTALLCAPYTLVTWRVAKIGWHGEFSVQFVLHAIPESLGVLSRELGLGGLVLLAIGLWALVGAGLLPSRPRPKPFWAVMAIFLFAAFAFENVVPAGIENRKLFVLIAPAVLFIVAGARHVAALILGTMVARRAAVTAAILVLTAAGTGFRIFSAPPRQASRLHDLAANLAARQELKNTALLVSAGSREGLFVGEMARREQRPNHYILRATKHLLWDCGDSGMKCPARFSDGASLLQFLDSVPVSAVVVEVDQPRRTEEVVLRSALSSAPEIWQVHALPSVADSREAYLYTRRTPLPWQKPAVSVDLGGKLDRLF